MVYLFFMIFCVRNDTHSKERGKKKQVIIHKGATYVRM